MEKPKLLIDSDDILEYLDDAIRYWRRMADMKKPPIAPIPFKDRVECKCYIDAFQSMRKKLFGELLLP